MPWNEEERKKYDPRKKKRSRELINAYKARRRGIVETLKDVPCKDCGGRFDPVCMDFDHIGEKNFNVSVALSYGRSMDDILREIETCDVVCSNCHRLRTKMRKIKNAMESGDE